jgi:hypothetical protein
LTQCKGRSAARMATILPKQGSKRCIDNDRLSIDLARIRQRSAPGHTTTEAAVGGTISVVGRFLELRLPGTNSVTTPVTRTESPGEMVASNMVPDGPKMRIPSEVASLVS